MERRTYIQPVVHTVEPVRFHPHLMLIMGGSGAGKSTLAEYINHLYTLQIHNQIALDVDEFRRPELAHNAAAALREAHAHHIQHALAELKQGRSVAMIGVYGRPEYRDDKRLLMRQEEYPFLTVLLEVDLEHRIRDVLRRPVGTSDVVSREQVAAQQLSYENADLIIPGRQSLHKTRAMILELQKERGLVL